MNHLPTLYAVYDADGSLTGELAYLFGKFRGTNKCALCEISHGWNPIGKREWRSAQGVASTLTWLHRDRQPENIKATTDNQLPAIVVVHAGEPSILIGADALSECSGDYQQFETLLATRLHALLCTANQPPGRDGDAG